MGSCAWCRSLRAGMGACMSSLIGFPGWGGGRETLREFALPFDGEEDELMRSAGGAMRR